MRAPVSRIWLTALKRCRRRIVPDTCIRSACSERSPVEEIVVSTQSSLPPMSDSQSQIADRFELLALVLCPPVTCDRDKPRSRRTRRPLPSKPGSSGQEVRPEPDRVRAHGGECQVECEQRKDHTDRDGPASRCDRHQASPAALAPR